MFKVIELKGIPYETKDDIDLITEKEALNALYNALDEYTGLYTYVIRDEESSTPGGDFEEGSFPYNLNEDYKKIHGRRKAFINRIYLVVARVPHIGLQKKLNTKFQIFKKPFKEETRREYSERFEKLNQTVLEITKRLTAYSPRVLTVVEGKYSEPLEFLNYLINHRKKKVVLPYMCISKYLSTVRHFFGRETIEIRHETKTEYAAIIAIKEYCSMTDAGMLNDLLKLPIKMTVSQSFFPFDRQKGLDLLEKAQDFLIMADDKSISQTAEITEGEDKVASGKVALGEHTFYVTVFADNQIALIDNIAKVQSELGIMYGLQSTREDWGLEGAFWSILPCNGEYIARGTPITSMNFAGFSSFHSQPEGQRNGNHWGDAVCVLATTQGTPYFFNFHVGDLGHTTLIGPSGFGKTLLLCFLLAQSQKFNPRMIYFDYELGADIFIKAIGGKYHIISPETKTGMNPLQLHDTPESRSFLNNWLAMLLTPNGEKLQAEELESIKNAVDGNYELDQEDRQLRNIKAFLSSGGAGSLSNRLEQWYGKGERSYLFDNEVDGVDFKKGITGFDMTHLIKDPVGRTPVFFYLLTMIEKSLDGTPTIIPIDEAWVYFRDPFFAPKIEELLKLIRRKNGILVMGTNDVADAARSAISSTIITQSATNIFFGNNKANIEEYKKFGLSEKEIEIIRGIQKTDHKFLLKQGHNSGVLKLDLTGLEQYIPLLSSRKENVSIVNELCEQVGNDPREWIPLFMERISKG